MASSSNAAVPNDTKIMLAEMTKNLKDLLQGGRFVADGEICDEDGSVCPTGTVTYIEPEAVVADEYDNPYVEAGYFNDPEDAVKVCQLIEDHGKLLKFVERLLASRGDRM